MASNRFPDQCALASCGKHIPAGAGILGAKHAGRWPVYCTPEELHQAEAAPGQRPAAAPYTPPPPAEVRITGSPEQCAAIMEAIRYTAFMTIVEQSQPQPRRDDADPRVMVYSAVAVDPRRLQAEANSRPEATR